MTYSIIGRDDQEIGVAVQSQAFNAGAAVAWVRAGAGAVATQSFNDRRYGYRGLELLGSGRAPQDALDELRAADSLPQFRQVAFMSPDGTTAQWTGQSCIDACGALTSRRTGSKSGAVLDNSTARSTCAANS